MTSEGNLVELDKFSGEYHCSSGRSGTHVVYRFEEYLEWTGGGSRRVQFDELGRQSSYADHWIRHGASHTLPSNQQYWPRFPH